MATSRCHEVATSTKFRPARANSTKDMFNPDVDQDAARKYVDKLEKTLEVLGDATGPAGDALKSELNKARQAAEAPPSKVQIVAPERRVDRVG